jgi:hypothetical protein
MVWLESALQRPSGRTTLLDPDARVIAVGPAIPEEGVGLGAAVTTYSLFESEDHAADESLFLRRIKEARAALGLGAPVRIQTPDDVQKGAARARHEELTPLAALHEMLETVSWDSGAPAYGYVLETNDLSRVDVPAVFLKSGQLRMVLAITHHRAPGAAWGQYVVFTLLSGAGASPALQASRSRVPPHG